MSELHPSVFNRPDMVNPPDVIADAAFKLRDTLVLAAEVALAEHGQWHTLSYAARARAGVAQDFVDVIIWTKR